MNLQIFSLIFLLASVVGKSKDADEDRPYEFGFKVDGQQHRHESKDINGIIMGEFGFITADGVYHVTVYATDENGFFRILSMKNIKVSPPLDQPSTTTTTTTTPRPTAKAPYVFTTIPSLNKPSCSSCALPSVVRPPNDNKLPFQTPAFQNKPSKQQQPPKTSPSNQINPNNPFSQPNPAVTISNGNINVPGNDPIPIKDKYPNMVQGLPNGITQNDMLDLLYKFNYTLGFHGHHEKGLKNGAKIGGYFVNGRDGISRIVEYIADENGYRPKVKFINLGLDSPDTPKPGSEKKFGLKGFEFVWYPLT